jgi:hypothetical protein
MAPTANDDLVKAQKLDGALKQRNLMLAAIEKQELVAIPPRRLKPATRSSGAGWS